MTGGFVSDWYEPLEWALVRTPLLPAARYLEFSFDHDDQAAVGAARGNGGGWRGSAGDLPAALREPAVRRALAVASPVLFEQLAQPTSDPSVRRRRRLATLRYLIRMTTRCTPYGLMAAVSLAGWGDRTDLELGDGEVIRARLDMGLIDTLIEQLEARLEVARELRLSTHPLVLMRAGRAFLPERFSRDTGAFEVSVRTSAPVARALELGRQGPTPFADLARALAAEFPQASSGQIDRLIHGLLREGLLTSELRPPLTGGDPIAHLQAALRPIAAARSERDHLAAAVEACEEWQANGVGDGAEQFPAVVRAACAVAPPQNGIPPVRVDMARPLAGDRITGALAEEAARAAELLLRLSPLQAGQVSINAYRDRFLDRYSTDTEVPLVELLDPDLGLGPVDLRLDTAPGPWLVDTARRRDPVLLRIATSAIRSGTLAVELDDETMAELSSDPPPERLPVSLELSAFVDARSREALDAGEFCLVVSPMLGSHGAGRILGRFGHLMERDVVRAMKAAADREQASAEARVWAELVYTPERPWLNNVMLRPGVRTHELVVGGTPGVDRDHVIPIDQLIVGVAGDMFYLRWPARGVYVEVCEGHMLNPKTAPAVGTFLALMRHAGRPIMTGFSWGAARELPRLPRVQRGRIILSPATWHPCFSDDALTACGRFAGVLSGWRAEWGVPRQVFAGQGDQRLLLDLDDPAHVDLLRGLMSVKEGDRLVLQEPIPDVESGWLPGRDGRFLVELAVPLALRSTIRATSPNASASSARPQPPPADLPLPPPRRARMRAPGSDWLYAKLYAGGIAAERLIGHELRWFAREALADGLAEDWFFVRLRDPRPHVRIRFRGNPSTLTAELAPRLYTWTGGLLEDGACESFALDTYWREMERYGGDRGMQFAEAIFGADSRLVADLIELDLADEIPLQREHLCVLTLDHLLSGLGLDSDARREWCRACVMSRHEVSSDWREHKSLLRSLLSGPSTSPQSHDIDALTPPLARLAAELAELGPHGHDLASYQRSGQIRWPRPEALYASFAHMHCNRLLGLDRNAERRVLGLLLRTMESLSRAPARTP